MRFDSDDERDEALADLTWCPHCGDMDCEDVLCGSVDDGLACPICGADDCGYDPEVDDLTDDDIFLDDDDLESDVDPDGESFRGSEAAAFDREELMRLIEDLK